MASSRLIFIGKPIHKRRYGARRIASELRDLGCTCGVRRASKLLQTQGLKAIQPSPSSLKGRRIKRMKGSGAPDPFTSSLLFLPAAADRQPRGLVGVSGSRRRGPDEQSGGACVETAGGDTEVTYGSRSVSGARRLATMLTVIETSKRHGHSALDFLVRASNVQSGSGRFTLNVRQLAVGSGQPCAAGSHVDRPPRPTAPSGVPLRYWHKPPRDK